MSDTQKTDAPLFGRDAVISFLEKQLAETNQRIYRDVKKIAKRNDSGKYPPTAFLIYPLKTNDDKLLSEEYLKDFDVTLPAIQKTEPYKQAEKFCTDNDLELDIDLYIQFSSKYSKRYVRLVVEGM